MTYRVQDSDAHSSMRTTDPCTRKASDTELRDWSKKPANSWSSRVSCGWPGLFGGMPFILLVAFFFLPTKQWLMIVHTSHGLWWARNAGKCTEGLHNCENATGPQVTPAAFWMPAAPAAEQLDRKVQHFLNSPLKAWTAARLSPHLSKSISRLSAFASIRESFSPLPAAS